jgi:hypothetical protein
MLQRIFAFAGVYPPVVLGAYCTRRRPIAVIPPALSEVAKGQSSSRVSCGTDDEGSAFPSPNLPAVAGPEIVPSTSTGDPGKPQLTKIVPRETEMYFRSRFRQPIAAAVKPILRRKKRQKRAKMAFKGVLRP